MLDDVPLDIYATVLCFKRGTWQRCVLTQTEVDDCDGDTFFFDWIEVPGPGQDSERGRLLAWLRQNPEQNADGMNLSAWPLLKLTWDYAGAGSVSHVNARHDVGVRRGPVRHERGPGALCARAMRRGPVTESALP